MCSAVSVPSGRRPARGGVFCCRGLFLGAQGLRQLHVSQQIVAPVPGNAALPFAHQGALQPGDDLLCRLGRAMAGQAGAEARQIALPLIKRTAPRDQQVDALAGMNFEDLSLGVTAGRIRNLHGSKTSIDINIRI